MICDEGHRIKNDNSNISQALKKIVTRSVRGREGGREGRTDGRTDGRTEGGREACASWVFFLKQCLIEAELHVYDDVILALSPGPIFILNYQETW